ncbi:hypothetical protein DWUX_267 [Desulfovibrio diazotrophicus]|nr:hypothetical protein DWUX_267 [Desulfovibrio diazotrophicus]
MFGVGNERNCRELKTAYERQARVGQGATRLINHFDMISLNNIIST